MNKKIRKKQEAQCCFCNEKELSLLDCHRIIPGGKYSEYNVAVCCSNCHRKIHAGIIEIKGKHFSTVGYLINYIENGEEKWTKSI